jgi:adenosylmethionine-8-amino-7-oxononanoate aminotransferase
MKTVCDKYGALLILDEVMCGMGRSGTIHAWQQEDIEPDIQTLGKGLGGGYAPIAAVLMNHRIISTLDKGSGNFSHGQTYQGHPVACAAAFEVQNIVKKGNLVSNVAKMGKLLEEGLKANLEDHPNVGNIRGKGLFWGIEFVKDRKTKEAFPPEMGLAMLVHSKGIEEPYNISIYPGTGSVDGWSGDHVLLAPAYNVTEEEIDFIVTQTGKVIHAVFEELSYNA